MKYILHELETCQETCTITANWGGETGTITQLSQLSMIWMINSVDDIDATVQCDSIAITVST